MNLEADVNAQEHKWAQWDTGSQIHVADEVVRNAVEQAANNPAALLQKYPKNTFADALAACEADERKAYDANLAATYEVCSAETTALREHIEAEIAKSANVPSERDVHGKGTSNWIMAGVHEELVLMRLRTELAAMTLAEVRALYPTLEDERDRTALRLIEDAVITNRVTRLGTKPDPEHAAIDIPALQKAVDERRRARVPAHLRALRDRVDQMHTATRRDLRRHLASGRGIARRPLPMRVAI